MNLLTTEIQGVFVIEPSVYPDHRGFFMESYNQKMFENNGILYEFIQDNHSYSKEKGVIRGLHYQLNPKAQTKLVRVASGSVYDVMVDLRHDSDTFGQWIGVLLSDENHRQVLVPRGIAHGFCTLVPGTTVLYKVDEYYDPSLDRGIMWNDPHLNIDWPVTSPILSGKDRNLPPFNQAEFHFSIKE
ncbi:dTDP-4-dehydrorhamnose 3,5-epimerase [Rossellomorea sp. AcN35-11]|nr:dTDP-4-dehydrorhamnose 3,5-epimerase [Rossellomorea aquimaris]WJV29543.1 dTDP-4-dehydrorhamnose 3,5-epimerase [Rossellomorea sp. AcN35-11]